VVPLPYNGNESNKSTTKMYRTECHTVWAPFRGNAGGMGAFDGPFSLGRGRPLFPRKAGRASFLAISGHKPVGTRQTSDQPDRDQHGPRGRPLFPRKVGRASFLAITGSQTHGHKADQDQPDQDQQRSSGRACLLFACYSPSHKPNSSRRIDDLMSGCAHSCAESKLDGRDNH